MRRAGVWIGRSLRVLGLVAFALGVLQGGRWAFVAGVGGVVLAFGLTVRSLVRLWAADLPQARPLDFPRVIDWLRRAHGASAGWLVGLHAGDVAATRPTKIETAMLQRGAAVVRLAASDGRTHVVRGEGVAIVAVGDSPYGAGLLLGPPEAGRDVTERVAEDLRGVVASMRLAELGAPESRGELLAKRLARAAAGAQSLESVARAGAVLAQQVAQRGAVIAVRDPAGHRVTIAAVSPLADKRLENITLAEDAPATRAVNQGVPIVTHGGEDIFGVGVPERRRRERAGTAYPLFDGLLAVGTLVLVGEPVEPDGAVADQIGRLVVELGPRLAAARAVREAERRATRDPLTGLCNLREFERVLERFRAETTQRSRQATLVYADLDHFKQLNDTLGHAAGDEALRHVAQVFQKQVRDGDLVARIGGEEFAMWLPHTPLREGLEVAKRIRRAVEETPWQWNGEPRRITTSCGVAACPDTVADVNNLRAAADAALYRAKQTGRNRVELALRGD